MTLFYLLKSENNRKLLNIPYFAHFRNSGSYAVLRNLTVGT